jgi:NADH:ubiquinone oxidoreductase subunit 3 (subunit A)
MWFVNKWGAVICLVITVLAAAAIVLFLIQGTLDLAALIEMGSFILVGVGQVYLWRKGKLT